MPRLKQRKLTLNTDEQARLAALSGAHGLTDQEFLRRAVVALSDAPAELVGALVAAGGKVSTSKLETRPAGSLAPDEVGPPARLNLRLGQREKRAIDAAAAAYGLKPSPWSIKVLRTASLRQPNLLPAELAGLADASRQVNAIGVNINQIAKRLNETGELASRTPQVMQQAATDIKKLRDSIAALIRASVERWA